MSDKPELIEWKDNEQHDVSWGNVAGRCVFTITKPYAEADNHNIYWGLGNPGHNQEHTVYDSMKSAKLKAEELFDKWLNEIRADLAKPSEWTSAQLPPKNSSPVLARYRENRPFVARYLDSTWYDDQGQERDPSKWKAI